MKKRCYKNNIIKKRLNIKRIIASSLVIILSLYILPNSVSANILFHELENQQEKEIPKRDEESVEVPKEEQPSVEAPKEKGEESVEVPKEEQPSVEAPKEEDEESVEVPKEEELIVEAPKEEQQSVEVPKGNNTTADVVNSSKITPTIFDGTLDGAGKVTGGGINSTGTIFTSGTYKITGKSTSTNIIVENGVVANVVFDNITITNRMVIKDGAEVNLYLIGENIITGGINVVVNSVINIIGGDDDVKKLKLSSHYSMASIGGNSISASGKIVITGGEIDAETIGGGAAAIGGGNNAYAGEIIIGGDAVVNAYVPEEYNTPSGAGIGDGGGAGIGINSKLVIRDNAKVTARGADGGAGIGEGRGLVGSGQLGEIEILGNADVTARAGRYWVAIGGTYESVKIDKSASVKMYGGRGGCYTSRTETEAKIVGFIISSIKETPLLINKVGTNMIYEMNIPQDVNKGAMTVKEDGIYQAFSPNLDGKILSKGGSILLCEAKTITNIVDAALVGTGVLTDPPAVIEGLTDIEINVGEIDTFDYLSGVTVKDINVDNTIQIIPTIIGTVGKPALGTKQTYNLTYKVVDSGNNVTTLVRKITVKNYIPAVISGADDITIKFGEVDIFDLLNGVIVTDDKDIGLVATVTGSVGKPISGTDKTYDITYEVTDSDGNITTKVRKVTVTNQLPTIDGLSDIIILEGQTSDIQVGVTANDNEDGDITGNLVFPVTDLKMLKKGNHEIQYSVLDSDGNTTTANRNIIVEGILDKIVIPKGITLIKDASGVAMKKDEIKLISGSLKGTFEIKTNPIIEIEVGGDKVEVEVINESGNKIGADRVLGEVKTAKPKQEFTLKAPLKSFQKGGIYSGNITFEIEYKKMP